MKRWKEAEAHLRDLMGEGIDSVEMPGGGAILLQPAQGRVMESEAEAPRSIDLQKTVLDALHAHIALIDDQGTIRFVNEAWRHFAEGNALQDPTYGVGQNYIELCERAQGECAEEAHQIGEGIRSVLRKELREFTLQYPCHSPTDKRWFRVRVFPLRDPDSTGAVILHVDVTDVYRAEQAARHGESKYHSAAKELSRINRDNQRILDFSLDVTCTIDAEGTFVQMNAAAETVWGYTPDELIGTKFITYVLPEDRERSHRAAEQLVTEKKLHNFENRYVRKNGTLAEMVWSANWSDTDQVMFCVARDVTESRRALESLRRNEAMLSHAQRIARPPEQAWSAVR
jgi:PAS domain S-box-containing protein